MLDAAGYPDCGVCASNSLDEYLVRDLILQGAQVTNFGIGENMITSKSDPCSAACTSWPAVKDGGRYLPKIKISETAEKTTIPHLKNLYRIYDNDTGKAMADYITMADETVDVTDGITLFDPVETLEKAYLYQRARRTAEPSHLCERKARVRKPAAAGYPGFLRRSGGDSVG